MTANDNSSQTNSSQTQSGNLNRYDSAKRISQRIMLGELKATEVIQDLLEGIERLNPQLNCYTWVAKERALARAKVIDEAIAKGQHPGPLAGVPFAVKNLYDIEGVVTLAGSKINADNPAAKADAQLIKRMEAAGAILVGGLAMGEYAYDFTGENEHYGACCNPWDTRRMTGGSSSGSGSATAAGLAPISLGSDTNGSIRVPASLCGLFGLKPTYGRLPRTGTYPFSDSLDHLGPLSRSVEDLVLAFGALQDRGSDMEPEMETKSAQTHVDPAYAKKPAANLASIDQMEISSLRVARATGFFDCSQLPQAEAAVSKVCAALKSSQEVALEGAQVGRAAAYLITNSEGSALHRDRIINRVEDFDKDTRERFLAGALLPSSWYLRAQSARRWWQEQMLTVFDSVDLIIAPTTPCSAPLLGTSTLKIGDKEELLRPNLGIFTQPFSCIGLPVVNVPLWTDGDALPIGVQLVAPPWREDICLAAAAMLEKTGVAQCRIPPV